MERLVGVLFVAWLAALAVGVVIALAPVVLFVVGFLLTMAILALIGRLFASWLGY